MTFGPPARVLRPAGRSGRPGRTAPSRRACHDGAVHRLPIPRPAASRAAAVPAALVAALATPAAALAHGSVPPDPPDALAILLTWRWEPSVAIPLVVAALGWLALAARVDAAHPDSPVPFVRTLCWFGGLGAIALALQSGIEGYDTTLFSIHMIQHMLLVFVAAPLLALGAPVTLLLRAATPGVRARWILPVLHSRALRVLAHPVVAWILFTAVMWLSHFSPLFDAALEDRTIHELEHALFLGSGLLFWWPVVGLDPAPHRMRHVGRIMYAFLQMPQNSFLAMAVLFAEEPLYHHYATLGAPYGIDALADQKLAGGLMWFFGDLLFLGVLAGLLWVWMRSEQRSAAAADRRVDGEREALRRRADAFAARKAARLAGETGADAGEGVAAPEPQPAGGGAPSSSR
jgi:putative membrane protein